MVDAPRLGAKLRALRRRERLTQVELAEKLGISPSYLNLIENNRRPLTAPVLIRLAQLFQLDLTAFATGDDARLLRYERARGAQRSVDGQRRRDIVRYFVFEQRGFEDGAYLFAVPVHFRNPDLAAFSQKYGRADVF